MSASALPIVPLLDLRPHNSLGARSSAEFGLIATSDAQVVAALHWAEQKGIAAQILGGGSNVIPAPEVSGLTIVVQTRGVTLVSSNEGAHLQVQAGEVWHDLVRYSLAQGLGDLANMVLIPGSVGAAPIQNIGAYGSDLAQTMTRLQAFDRHTGAVSWLSAQECEFGYRASRFKEQQHRSGTGPRYVILSVELALSRSHAGPLQADRYGDVNAELRAMGKSVVWPVDVAEAVCRIRRRKLPDPRAIGNVGSVFKNPVVSAAKAQALQEQWPSLASFPSDTGVRLAAAQLIDLAGWKGRSMGAAAVWQRQPLVLVLNQTRTPRGAAAASGDFMILLESIRKDIKARFDVALEVEPRRLV